MEQTTLTFGQVTIHVMWELIKKFWNQDSLPENSEIHGGSKTDNRGGRTAEESTDESYFSTPSSVLLIVLSVIFCHDMWS